jgi:hypothetical protein
VWDSEGLGLVQLPCARGLAVTPDWLDSGGLHGYLLGEDVRNAQDRQQAAGRYAALVDSSPDLQIWAEGLRQQIFLGDEDFVLHMQALMAAPHATDKNIPKPQRLLPHKPLPAWLEQAASREAGLFKAHTQVWVVDVGHGTDAGVVGVAGEPVDSSPRGAASIRPGHLIRGAGPVRRLW